MKTSVTKIMMSFALMGCLIFSASDAMAQGRSRSQGGSPSRSQSAAVSSSSNRSSAPTVSNNRSTVSRPTTSSSSQVSRPSSNQGSRPTSNSQVSRPSTTSSNSQVGRPSTSSSQGSRPTSSSQVSRPSTSSTSSASNSGSRPGTGASTRGDNKGGSKKDGGSTIAPLHNGNNTAPKVNKNTSATAGSTTNDRVTTKVTGNAGNSNFSKPDNGGKPNGGSKPDNGGKPNGGSKPDNGGKPNGGGKPDNGGIKPDGGGKPNGGDRPNGGRPNGGNKPNGGKPHGDRPGYGGNGTHYDYNGHHYSNDFHHNYTHHNWSWSRPLPPPARPYRPAPLVWYRPVIPAGWYPYASAPIIDRILGITFGTLFDASLDYLYYNGYEIDGYADHIVYLRDVPLLNMIWDDGMLCYDSYDRLVNAQFVYQSSINNKRYDRVYRNLCRVYGSPFRNSDGSFSWYGGNNTGWITLSTHTNLGYYYTTMSIGY